MIHKPQKNTRQLRHRQAATAKQLLRRKRPLHRKVLLHPITIFALLCVGVLLAGTTWHSLAATYTIRAKVPAPLLTDPAVITSPADGITVKSAPITVSGTCPADSYVTLTRNNLFSGVDTCDNSTLTFSITTDLFAGANQLVAQDYNLSDDAGPASPGITVTYNPPSPPPSSGGGVTETTQPESNTVSLSGGNPLIPAASFQYQAFQAGQDFQWNISISGGTAPYKVKAAWGDGTTTNYKVSKPQTFTISHTYANSGKYTILVDITDVKGAKTEIQLVAIIKGKSLPAATASGSTGGPSRSSYAPWLWLAVPAYSVVALMAVSFWLGEREELRHLAKGRRRTTSRPA
jgi:hypothetical protein